MVIENTYCWSPLQAVMFGLGPREIPKVGVSKNWSVQEMTGLGSFTAPNSWGGEVGRARCPRDVWVWDKSSQC